MDRVELFQRIEGKRLLITKGSNHIETEIPVRISLDGEIQWNNCSILPEWDSVEEIVELDDDMFSFIDNGIEVVITTLD